jgi:hypothetical protein
VKSPKFPYVFNVLEQKCSGFVMISNNKQPVIVYIFAEDIYNYLYILKNMQKDRPSEGDPA